MKKTSEQQKMDSLGQAAAPPAPQHEKQAKDESPSVGQPAFERPTPEQWKQLFEVARHIREVKPWEYMYESELITIMLPGREEPVYCSVMGSGGENYAIGIYPGYESIRRFYSLAKATGNIAPLVLGLEQSCFACNFGDREEITPEDREVYKALGLRFRGHNEWIYFRTMDPGYIPWYITREQAELLIQVLQNFVMALGHFLGGKIEVNFEEGETLLRFYSPEKELWLNTAVKMPPRPVITPKLIVDDEMLTASLKKRKRNGASLELEVTYLPVPVQKHKEDRPFFPRMVLLMDSASKLPVGQHMAEKDDRIETDILDMLTAYIEKSGRPVSINVRDDRAGRYIEDFCRKVNIQLIDDKGVPAVDSLLEGLLSAMDGGILDN